MSWEYPHPPNITTFPRPLSYAMAWYILPLGQVAAVHPAGVRNVHALVVPSHSQISLSGVAPSQPPNITIFPRALS